MNIDTPTNFNVLLRSLGVSNSSHPPLQTPLSQLLRSMTPAGQPTQTPVRIVRPKVFVSFDYENDKRYKFLLEACSANSRFEFTFNDKTPREIQSNNVGRIKAVITSKISESKYTVVLVGKYANQPHIDRLEIGELNWIHFELKQSMNHGNKIVVVLLEPTNQIPTNILGKPGVVVNGFDPDGIAIELKNV